MDPTSFLAVFALGRDPDPLPKIVAPAPSVAKFSQNHGDDGGFSALVRDLFPPFKRPDKQVTVLQVEKRVQPRVDPAPRRVAISSPHSSWMLADRFGQVWTHEDKVWLERWVAARNVPRATPVYYQWTNPCVSGRCPR